MRILPDFNLQYEKFFGIIQIIKKMFLIGTELTGLIFLFETEEAPKGKL